MHSADVNVVNLTFYCILLKRNICDAVHKFNYIHLTKSMTQVNVLVVVSPVQAYVKYLLDVKLEGIQLNLLIDRKDSKDNPRNARPDSVHVVTLYIADIAGILISSYLHLYRSSVFVSW